MSQTKISWTNCVANPFPGCRKVSEGCANCYAERMARRLKAMGRPAYQDVVDEHGWTGKVGCNLDAMKVPGKGKMVFCESMGDLFYEGISYDDWRWVWHMMTMQSDHTFQVLTKRPEQAADRIRRYSNEVGPSLAQRLTDNIWLGVTCENQQWADKRIPILLQIPAAVRFISLEPLLGPVELTQHLLHERIENDGITSQRRESLRGCYPRETPDRCERTNLEDHKEVPTLPGRKQHRAISANSCDDRGDSISCPCPPTGMDSSPRANSGRLDSQSQERQQAGQPARESGTDDTFRANATYAPSAEEGSGSQSTRRGESHGSPYRQTSVRDQKKAGDGRKIECHRQGLQDQFSTDFSHCSSQNQGLNFIIIGCESGPGRRECKLEWVDRLLAQAEAAHVPSFVKQIAIDQMPWKTKVIRDAAQIASILGRTVEEIRQFPRPA